MSKGIHRGTCISMWMSPGEMEKINALTTSSGQSRTQLFKNLLARRPVPDKSYWKTYKQLASLGGMIKRFVDNGQHGNAFHLGLQVLQIAQELERQDKERAESCHP